MAGTRPSFSVVIATYNMADLVSEAVMSALEQTYPPLEVIVADDGSQDETARALSRFDTRITLLRVDHRGPAAARNAAFRIARGDFVAILDADDVFLPRRLEALAEAAQERPDLDILTTDAAIEVDGHATRRYYGADVPFEVEDQRLGIIRRNFILSLAAVRRARLLQIGGMDESLVGSEDWDLWFRLILDGSRAGLLTEVLARRRAQPTGLSARREAFLEDRVSALQKMRRAGGMRPRERHAVARMLSRTRTDLELKRARRMARCGAKGARRQALQVVLARPLGQPGSRLRAAMWAVAPSTARGRSDAQAARRFIGPRGSR